MNPNRTRIRSRLAETPTAIRHRKRPLGPVTGLVLGLTVALSAQADTRAGAFQMLVAEDSAPGRHLIDGDVDAALALSETRSLNRFNALNNHCVSLTLKGELDKAEVVCNDAVRQARRSEAGYTPGRAYQGATIDPRSRRAMAFTNRGVLHALQGRGELARDDFESAVVLNGRLSAATENLAVLETRPAVASID